MKKIEELGISPAPWKVGHHYEKTTGTPYSNINAATGYYVADGISDADKRLIAAAPELYEALIGLLEIVCQDCKSSYEIDHKCVKCPRVIAAEKALAKAAGESEVK